MSFHLIKSKHTFISIVFLVGLTVVSPSKLRAEEFKDAALAALTTNGDKANYCFYSESLNVQMAASGSNPMAALQLIQTVQEWQRIVNTLLPDRDTRNQRMVGSLKEFNRQQTLYKGIPPEEAKRKVVEKNSLACNELLAHLQASELKPETVSRSSPADAKKNVTKQRSLETKKAKPWFNEVDYVGTWKTTRVMHKVSYVNSIFLDLWQGTDGKPQGVALFVGESTECPGKLTLNANDKLTFEPMNSAACINAKPGYFNMLRSFKGPVAMLAFVPEGVQENPQLMLTNTASFRRLQDVPATLKSLAVNARSGKGSINENLRLAGEMQAEIVSGLRIALQGDFNQQYSESELIGVWRGEFIDKLQTYPAEIAMWSVKDTLMHRINGIIHFNGDLCTSLIQVRHTGQQQTWSISSLGNAYEIENCESFNAPGMVRLSADRNRLAIGLSAQQKAQGSMSFRNCLRDLPNIETPGGCAVAGLFERSSASASLDQVMAAITWNHTVKAPANGHWNILRRNDSGLSKLVFAHDEGLEQNAQFLAQREKNYAEAERRRKVKEQAQQRQRREEKALEEARRARTAKEWEARRGERPSAAAEERLVLPELPKVNGPFNGLSGGDFLNALYHGDLDAISTFDKYYQIRKIKQRRDWVGKHWSDNFMDAAVKSFRMADTVLTIFLFNYDSKYKACLKDDSVTFEVVKVVPDVVIENLIGVEVSRFYGYTERKHYKINKEFTIAFRRVGTTEPEGGMATLSDFLLNMGGTDLRRELLAGTKQMMDKFTCDSEEIKKIEQTLLQFSTR